MSFTRGFSKPTPPPASKQGASTNLAGFSLKQLEDEDEDDLAYTGKYERLIEDSQKAQKKSHEHTSSISLVSLTSSAPGEITSPENSNLERMTENVATTVKSSASVHTETTSSSLRTAARAKLETSKDLFSGLRGKITDKISRTIEEFSGDSSSSSNLEKEKTKFLSKLRVNSHINAEKNTDAVISAAVVEIVSPAAIKRNAVSQDMQNKSSHSLIVNSDSSLSLVETSNTSVNKMAAVKKGVTLSSQKDTVSKMLSDSVDNHPLAKSDAEDYFENVIEPPGIELLTKRKQHVDDRPVIYDSHSGETNAGFHVSEEYFATEPADFISQPGFWRNVQLNSNNKMKCLLKKNELKPAFVSMSDVHYSHDEKFFSLDDEYKEHSKKGEDKQNSHKLEDKKLPSDNKSTPVLSKSAANIILQQLSLEDRSLSYQKLITVAVLLFAYFIVPMPSYISGFIMGTFLASLGWSFYMRLMEQPRLPEPSIHSQLNDKILVPEMKVTVESKEFVYKGWMNELAEYSVDDYHINKTHSIFVSLEESHLRMQRPKNALPKRAMWDEQLLKPQFIHQRHFDLPGSKVCLLPHGLVKKRIWSKKYPICIVLADRNSNDDVKLKHISSEPIIFDKKDKISDMGFEFVTDEKCKKNVLYLFARTGREKEEWFKRFSVAASGKPLANHVLEMKRALSKSSVNMKKNLETTSRHKRKGSTSSVNSISSEIPLEFFNQKEGEPLDHIAFAKYMGRLMPSMSIHGASTLTTTGLDKGSFAKETNKNSHKDLDEARVLNPSSAIFCDTQMFWINALIGRCFYDFLRDKCWRCKVKEKLQRKFSKIHVPYFIEELQVIDINMGCEVPGIRHASKPYIDEQGFWVDLDITYAGGFQMTIETKVNLMKLKKTPTLSTRSVSNLKSPVTDSDEEDSAESSTDEEEEAPSNSDDSSTGGGTSRKFLHYLNKITQSRYFQQATEYKVIKRAMENVSNTPLTLTVTVISLVGKLALNIPPPPSDRLWYGFRGNPHLRLSVKPQVGERAVTITHIVEWIEKKLAIEFQRVFVIPNMDDLIIPILVPGETRGSAMTRSATL